MTYASAISASRNNNLRQNRTINSYKPKMAKMGPVSMTLAVIISSCAVGLVYLTQVTRQNALGYKLEEYRISQTNLKNDIAMLELEGAKSRSLEAVAKSPTAQQLVKPAQTVTISQ